MTPLIQQLKDLAEAWRVAGFPGPAEDLESVLAAHAVPLPAPGTCGLLVSRGGAFERCGRPVLPGEKVCQPCVTEACGG